jgi:hypothetical protein
VGIVVLVAAESPPWWDARVWRRAQKIWHKVKKNCGKCGEQGHSIRTRSEMMAVSGARLKEVVAYGKAKSGDTQQAAQLGVRPTKAA